jgi:hypothetical protein
VMFYTLRTADWLEKERLGIAVKEPGDFLWCVSMCNPVKKLDDRHTCQKSYFYRSRRYFSLVWS